jgi:hypothetical protein
VVERWPYNLGKGAEPNGLPRFLEGSSERPDTIHVATRAPCTILMHSPSDSISSRNSTHDSRLSRLGVTGQLAAGAALEAYLKGLADEIAGTFVTGGGTA